jgi:raffinose/stachyose/melibiose transport system substrate-binding protein
MKKKALSMLLVTVLSFTMLAGCGSSTESSDTTTETTETTETTDVTETETAEAENTPVTIKTVSMFGGTDPNAEVYQNIITEFQTTYDYITVEDNSQSSDEEWKASVAADFSVGNEPDVLQFFTDATANQIVATDKFVTIEEIRAVYPEYAQDTLGSALDASKNSDGIQRAVPTTGFWEGLFCNKDLFDQYGLALPTDWESLKTAIAVFNENGIIPIACSLNNVPHYWVEFGLLYAAGAEGYEAVPESAPAEWIAGLESIKTLRDLGAFPVDTDTVDNEYVGTLFKSKQAAMQLDGSWFLGGIEDQENTVVIAFPGIENQKAEAGSMVGGISSGFYITRKAWDDPAKRDAAVKFVMAQTSQAAVQQYWEKGGAVGKAAVEVTPVEGMTNLALSALEYTNSATLICAPTDSRIDPEAYKTIIAGVVKVSTGGSAEDLINEA